MVSDQCGGVRGYVAGLTPVTLYGLPAAQAEISVHHFDGRLQMTTSSPANLMGWGISRQYLQWAGGAGVTIQQGLRVGGSAFSGPYLDANLSPLLPKGTDRSQFSRDRRRPGCRMGSRAFQHPLRTAAVRFDSPNFVVPPRILAGYVEVKARLTPRIYAAVRDGFLKTESVTDKLGVSASEFAPTLHTTEVGLGYWLRPRILAKVSYQFAQAAGSSGTRSNVLGLQLVASFNQLQWAWK